MKGTVLAVAASTCLSAPTLRGRRPKGVGGKGKDVRAKRTREGRGRGLILTSLPFYGLPHRLPRRPTSARIQRSQPASVVEERDHICFVFTNQF